MNQSKKGDPAARAISCLRELEARGDRVRGAGRTPGVNPPAGQWKYVNVRRVALYIESSLKEGLQWVVFEPNAEPLWGQIRLEVGSFLQTLFLQGAFQGTSPQQAYFVKCDADNNPQAGVNQGIVNITVGFAPTQPAEFVVIQIAQMTGKPPGDSQ